MDDKRINLETEDQLGERLLADQEAAHHEIRKRLDLIEPSELPEVGDEEREKLIEHLNLNALASVLDEKTEQDNCPICNKIIALLRQPRTVSRGFVERWASSPWFPAAWHITYDERINYITSMLAELGIQVEEPKKEGEEKDQVIQYAEEGPGLNEEGDK